MAPHSFRVGVAPLAKVQAVPDAASLSALNPGGWLKTLLLMGCGGAFWLACSDVCAQGREPAPTLAAVSHLWLTPDMERPLKVRVVPSEAAPPQSLIVIRGVPQGMSFSEGRLFGAGVWVLPYARLADLKLRTPKEIGGGMLTVTLTALDGAAIAETQITVISPPPRVEAGGTASLPPARDNPAARSTATTTPATERKEPSLPKPTTEKRAEQLLLLEKGKESLGHGNILIARQFFERAAKNGLAEAAFALAATYDPRELSRMAGGATVPPEPAVAVKWYKRARELGSLDADARLSGLARR